MYSSQIKLVYIVCLSWRSTALGEIFRCFSGQVLERWLWGWLLLGLLCLRWLWGWLPLAGCCCWDCPVCAGCGDVCRWLAAAAGTALSALAVGLAATGWAAAGTALSALAVGLAATGWAAAGTALSALAVGLAATGWAAAGTALSALAVLVAAGWLLLGLPCLRWLWGWLPLAGCRWLAAAVSTVCLSTDGFGVIQYYHVVIQF